VAGTARTFLIDDAGAREEMCRQNVRGGPRMSRDGPLLPSTTKQNFEPNKKKPVWIQNPKKKKTNSGGEVRILGFYNNKQTNKQNLTMYNGVLAVRCESQGTGSPLGSGGFWPNDFSEKNLPGSIS